MVGMHPEKQKRSEIKKKEVRYTDILENIDILSK